jgi:hypothetical protein
VIVLGVAGCTATTPPTPRPQDLYGVWSVTSSAGDEGLVNFTSVGLTIVKDDCVGTGSWATLDGAFVSNTWYNGSCWESTQFGPAWLGQATALVADGDGWLLLAGTGATTASLSPDSGSSWPAVSTDWSTPPITAEDASAEPVPLPGNLVIADLDGRWFAVGESPGGPALVLDGATWKVDVYIDPRADSFCGSTYGRWIELSKGRVLTDPASPGLTISVPEGFDCQGTELVSWLRFTRLAGLDGDQLVLLDATGEELGRLELVPPGTQPDGLVTN